MQAWLATVGFELQTAGDGAACSLLALISEQPCHLSVYAIPDAEIDGQVRAALDAAGRPNFSLYFDADLADQQFPGAMGILAACGVPGNQTVEEALQAELDLDWAWIRGGRDSWKRHEVASGAGPVGPVSHLYVANYAP